MLFESNGVDEAGHFEWGEDAEDAEDAKNVEDDSTEGPDKTTELKLIVPDVAPIPGSRTDDCPVALIKDMVEGGFDGLL